MSHHRSELHKEVVEALVSSKAVNFDVIGNVLAKYGARAALSGDAIGAIIHRRMIDLCIPVDPYMIVNPERMAGGQPR